MMLLWLDTETTGLDDVYDQILEVAWTITTPDLTPVSALRSHVIKPGPNGWARLHLEQNEVALQMHKDTLLYEELENPSRTTRLDVAVAEILSDIETHTLPDEIVQLAGASVHFDKLFLRRWAPQLHDRLHHRVYDTSTLKTFFESLGINHGVTNEGQHRAANDVIETLAVARAYRQWTADALNTFRAMGGLDY